MLEIFMVKVTLEGRVLLDISSTDNLVHYFQSLYGATDLYELKGLQITKYDMAMSNNVREVQVLKGSGQHKCFKDHCFAVVLYSICYSIISPCSYWNSNTLDAIIENGSQLNNTMHNEHSLVASFAMPDSVKIFDTKINVHINEVSQGELNNLTKSRISLETLILRNHIGKTGF